MFSNLRRITTTLLFFLKINYACEGNINYQLSHQAFGLKRRDHGCTNNGPNFPSQCTYKPKCHIVVLVALTSFV